MPLSEATINVLAPTSQFGANVFEGLRCYWNNEEQQLYIFRLEAHIKRLINSVKMFRMDLPYTKKELAESISDVVKGNNFKEDTAVRQTIFIDGFGSWSSKGPTDMFVAPIPKGRQYGDENIGINCCISSWERINDNSLSPKVKVGANYINSRMAQMEAVRNGYDTTILMNNNGKISEAPGSCVFIVRDGRLITPPVTASILESITRETIIQIAREELELDVEERDIDRSELYIADEIFLCGTAMEVVPIITIDRLKVGDGVKGKLTSLVEDCYFQIVRGNNPKYKHWLTPMYNQ
jgi:branched-chain amino acid aminotransferase